jgi:hypothetical protein
MNLLILRKFLQQFENFLEINTDDADDEKFH